MSVKGLIFMEIITKNTMILTRKLLYEGVSSKGGWSDEQLRLLGVKEKKKKWMDRLIGTLVSTENYQKFLSLKDLHVKDESDTKNKLGVSNLSKKQIKTRQVSQYNDDRWLAVRNIVLERDGYRCLICKKKGVPLHVHHWYYQGGFVWESDLYLLATLCSSCHKRVHSLKGLVPIKGDF